MEEAGFGNINIDIKKESRSFISKWAPNSNAADYIAAACIFKSSLLWSTVLLLTLQSGWSMDKEDSTIVGSVTLFL